MQIILTNAPAESDTRGIGFVPPLNLAYLGGALKRMADIQVSIVDGNGEGLYAEEQAHRIAELQPDIVGISINMTDINRSLKLLRLVRKARPDTLVIAGGYHPTAFDDILLEQVREIDMVIRGEADLSLPRLCESLQNGESIAAVPGLSFRSNGHVTRGVPQVVQDLDGLPFPDRSLLNEKAYFTGLKGLRIEQPVVRATGLISSRGCPFGCTFCSKLTPQHRKSRSRSVENLFSEVLELNFQEYECIAFVDENFTAKPEMVSHFCTMVLQHNLKMRFIFQGTLHNLSQSTLDLMHDAGFDWAWVGVESGSDAQLQRYVKAGSSRGIAAGIRRAKKAGLLVHGQFIVGAPNETEQDCADTVRFIKEARLFSLEIYELTFYPGTILWEDQFGTARPRRIEETGCIQAHQIPGLASRERINGRIAGLRRAYLSSWLYWGVLFDVLGLLRKNPLSLLLLRRTWNNIGRIIFCLLRRKA